MRVIPASVAFVVLMLSVSAGANYSGMCIKEFRYPSDAERVDAAVSFAMEQGWLPTYGQGNGIPYENAEQYVKSMPRCCAVSLEFVGGNHSVDRVLGRLSAYVSIRRDTQPNPNAARELFIAVSNCGRAWDWSG